MQAESPTIRPMRPDDAAAVIEMARELAAAVGDPEPATVAFTLIEDGFGPERWFDCLVAEISGQPAGYALMCKAFEAHTGRKRLWLGDLYIRPAMRRGGAGRALMAAIARHALDLNCDAVYWELWRPNVAGAAFYRRLMADEAADLAVMRLDKEHLAAIATNGAPLSAPAGE
jgi:GNAT superfamily N-acetyltransferase